MLLWLLLAKHAAALLLIMLLRGLLLVLLLLLLLPWWRAAATATAAAAAAADMREFTRVALSAVACGEETAWRRHTEEKVCAWVTNGRPHCAAARGVVIIERSCAR